MTILQIIFLALLLLFCLLGTVLAYALFHWSYFLLTYRQKNDKPDPYIQRVGAGRYPMGCGGLFWSFMFLVIMIGIVTIPGILFACAYAVGLFMIWKADNGRLVRYFSNN